MFKTNVPTGHNYVKVSNFRPFSVEGRVTAKGMVTPNMRREARNFSQKKVVMSNR